MLGAVPFLRYNPHWPVAQLVEHRTLTSVVECSSHSGPARKRAASWDSLAFQAVQTGFDFPVALHNGGTMRKLIALTLLLAAFIGGEVSKEDVIACALGEEPPSGRPCP